MARINTAKTLHNSYFDGKNYDLNFNSTTPMQVHQDVASQYDFATTEDPELLTDRKDTAEIIYKIFVDSSYNDGRFLIEGTQVMKIPKDSISEVFNYVKDELLNIKTLNPIELIISINEFFDFNYDYVYRKVLTPKMKQELLEDYYKNEGVKKQVNEGSSIKLF